MVPIDFICPVCKAKKGKLCVFTIGKWKGRERKLHWPRWRLANEPYDTLEERDVPPRSLR